MVIGEIGSLPKLLPDSLLSRSWIWRRPVSELTNEELFAFLKIHQASGRLTEARRNVYSLLHETYRLMSSGDIRQAPYATFVDQELPFTVMDLCECLEALSPVRRRAALFGLEMSMHPKEVFLLDWQSPKRLQLTPIAEAIVRTQPRHFRLNYVFWEWMSEGIAAPLFGFEAELADRTGFDFSTLLGFYRNMRWIDADAEVSSFLEEVH